MPLQPEFKIFLVDKDALHHNIVGNSAMHYWAHAQISQVCGEDRLA